MIPSFPMPRAPAMKVPVLSALFVAAALGATPPASAADPAPSVEAERLASPAVQRRLRVLERDLEDGLLTPAEFEGRRKALLTAEPAPEPDPPKPAVAPRRASLGVAVRDLEEPDRELLRAKAGALVVDVIRDGPAATAGLLAGDVITRADGQPVASAANLIALISGLEPGHRLALALTRRWQPVEAVVTLGRAVPPAPR